MQDLMDLLSETGLPFAYDHFAEGESPEPPFITFLIPASDNFSADGVVYLKVDVPSAAAASSGSSTSGS